MTRKMTIEFTEEEYRNLRAVLFWADANYDEAIEDAGSDKEVSDYFKQRKVTTQTLIEKIAGQWYKQNAH